MYELEPNPIAVGLGTHVYLGGQFSSARHSDFDPLKFLYIENTEEEKVLTINGRSCKASPTHSYEQHVYSLTPGAHHS